MPNKVKHTFSLNINNNQHRTSGRIYFIRTDFRYNLKLEKTLKKILNKCSKKV